ncbi:MAG: DUF2065 domain-containing protein [Halothiobacillaceae bacterium]|jgi:uncharacterized protein YjeT (DUF2065 family)|nr:MAG: DUF2065 domain-containing protein [Halothiobacillaceae bacterium]
MSDDLWAALALMLVFEGLLPFISPRVYRQSVEQLAALPDRMLRFVGMGIILFGLVLLGIVRG